MSSKKWKKLSSTQLFTHPRIEVYEDKVQLPNGHLTSYLHFGKARNSVTIIAVRKSGEILVQKEYSYPPNEWLFQFPGGGVEDGETLQTAAERELSEEASLVGELKLIGSFYTNNRRSDSKMHVFVARNLQHKSGTPDPTETFEDYWFSPDEITKKIAQSEIINASILSAWSLYVAQNGI